MVILLPSKYIFEKKILKIKDNIIERVEISATDVTPKNDYGVSVWTSEKHKNEYKKSTKDFKLIAEYVGGQYGTYQQFAGGTGVSPIFRQFKILIPVNEDNKYVSNVFYGKDKNGNDQIRSTIQYKKYTGTKQFRISYSSNPTTSFTENSPSVTVIDYEPYYDKIETGTIRLWSEEYGDGNISYKPITRAVSIGKETQKIVSSSFPDDTNLNYAAINKTEDGEYYEADITIWVGGEYYSGTIPESGIPQNNLSGLTYDFWATAEKIEPLKVDITINGNTIGINLEDETVYVNGETAKHIYSFEGNELMQTTNYIVDNTDGTERNMIQKLYGDTRLAYENGKETATIRCSISDYYLYGGKDLAISKEGKRVYFDNNLPKVYVIQPSTIHEIYAEIDEPLDFDLNIDITYTTNVTINDTLVIKSGKLQSMSISVGKVRPTNVSTVLVYRQFPMHFNLYDIVVPMIYKGGVDVPMSLKKDGTAKAFSVLGSKIYYDGAVWQELSLQEVGVDTSTQEDKERLVSPTITLNEEELEISFSGEVVESYDIFSNGSLLANVEATGELTIVNLADFELTEGSYAIKVVSKANGYLDSNPSNIVYYVVEVPDMIIEDIYMSGLSWNDESEYGEGILYYSPNSVETDNDGNTVFVYETLALKIIATGIGGKQDLTPPVFLKKGQKINFYPFYMDSHEYEESLSWKYTIVIPEKTRGRLTYYSKTKNEYWDLWSAGSIYWGYEPITIAFEKNAETGIDKITAKDSDGMGSIATDADFDYGVTIEVFERNTTFDNVQYVTQQTYNLLRRNLPQETISFTVDNEIYCSEKDMTWEQWVASEYNTNGYIIVDGILKNPINRMSVGGLLSNEMYIVQTAYDIIRPFAIYNAVNNFIGG